MATVSGASGHTGRVSELRIRPAMPDDDQTLADLVIDAYVTGGHLGPDDQYVSVLRRTAERRSQAEVLVAESDGELVGTVTMVRGGTAYSEFADEHDTEIRMLAVAPTCGGQGVGAALLSEVLDRSRALDAHGVALYTLDSMAAARTLYQRNGFHRRPDLDHEPAPGVQLRAYRLDLSE
jgi:ribosomal protein S18 acetylase RimI-like enzyme